MNIDIMPAMKISASGLDAERMRLDVAAHNLANAHTTRDGDGSVYQRRQVVFRAMLPDETEYDGSENLSGVMVESVIKDSRPPIEIHSPNHPHADEDGTLRLPNISPIEEMLDMITATRAYQSNLSALKQSRDMAAQTINILNARG